MNETQVRKELEKHGYVYLKGLSLSENIKRLATVKQGAKQGARVSFYTDWVNQRGLRNTCKPTYR